MSTPEWVIPLRVNPSVEAIRSAFEKELEDAAAEEVVCTALKLLEQWAVEESSTFSALVLSVASEYLQADKYNSYNYWKIRYAISLKAIGEKMARKWRAVLEDAKR